MLPDDNYRHAWQYFDEKLEPRAACKLMVGCLALAAEHDCETALGEHLLHHLQLGQIPDLLSLQKRFGQVPPSQPAQNLSQHTAASYNTLLSKTAQEVHHAAR